MVNILLADDHTLVRHGLRRVLGERADWKVVAETADGAEAVRYAVELKPDIAILDIGMPRLSGIEATRQIVRRVPRTRVLILSMYSDEPYVLQCLRAGATGYVLKDSADAEILQAVTALAQGKSFFSPDVSKVMLDEYLSHLADRGITDRYETLTSREREIFQLIAEGHSTKSMAAMLCLSPGTVETHRANIMEKLDLHGAAEVVLYAVRRGIVR